ncbi:MAG: hypothetical protein H6766_01460 [Candidatus Peribacteria bacterium]|nr:MAG: hypothetical protein H6766_01460 [Candidatus Peribacteria bacterium]
MTGIDSSGTVSISAYDFINLAQGKNAYTFLIDTIAPVIGIVAPQLTYTGNITTTTITITDDIALVTGDVTVSLIGVVGDLILQDVVCVQTYTSQVDCSLVVSSSSAGSGVLQVGVTDVAGNVMSALQTGYSIDTLGPLVNFSDNIEYTAYLTDTASLSVTDT